MDTDSDYFHILSTLLEVHAYHFMPQANLHPEISKRNILRGYSTSQLLLKHAWKLHEDIQFLSYAPHFVSRAILTASCITVSVLLSHYMVGVPLQAKDEMMQSVTGAMRACSIHDGDLLHRATNMLESYWSISRTGAPLEIPTRQISEFSHRLGTSLSFDCLRRWKRDVDASRPAADAADKRPPLDGTPGTRSPFFRDTRAALC